MASSRTNIKGFFYKAKNTVMKRFEQRLMENLPKIAELLHDYAEQELKARKMSSMTGNFINSFGVALYKDAQFVAVGTSHDIEGESPTQVTLANGDTFARGRMRYEGRMQFHSFTAPTGTHRFFANQEVIKWLQRYPPSKNEGFSFRVVSIVDYAEEVGGKEVLLRVADDIEGNGGVITQFQLG